MRPQAPHSDIDPSLPSPRAAAAWCWGSIALSAAVGVAARFWESTGSEFPAVFNVTGLMFAIYATGCLRAGGERRQSILIALFLYGVSFPWWGMWMSMPFLLVGGTFGLPQAALTLMVFRITTRSWIPGRGCLAGVAVGWVGQWILFGSSDLSFAAVLFLWHLSVVVSLVVWLNTVRLPENRRRLGLCTHCGYNRAGLGEGAVCPECGKLGVAA